MKTSSQYAHLGVVEAAWGLITAYYSTNRIQQKQNQESDFSIYICVARDIATIEGWAEGLIAFQKLLKHSGGMLLPFPPLPQIDWDLKGLDQTGERIRVLEALRKPLQEPLYIFTTPQALQASCPSPNQLNQSAIELTVGNTHAFKFLIDRLATDLDYDSEALCENPGQFSVRGGLIDVYPLGATTPYRLDFFGDTLEAIRPYDPTTQRSHGKVESISLSSAKLIEHDSTATLFDHLPAGVTWFLGELEAVLSEHPDIVNNLQARQIAANDTWHYLCENQAPTNLPPTVCIQWETEALAPYRATAPESLLGYDHLAAEEAARNHFLETLLHFQNQNEALFFINSTAGDTQRLKEELHTHAQIQGTHHELSLPHGFRLHWKTTPPIEFQSLKLPKNTQGLVFVTPAELFCRNRLHARPFVERKVAQRSGLQAHLDFESLTEGDLLVHIQHGICRFRGLQRLEAESEPVVTLEFQNQIKLYLPLHDTHLLSRYVGLSKSSPKLGTLGGKSWAKAKTEAEGSIRDFAAQMLRIQALRDIEVGHAFDQDHIWQSELEAAFPFQATRDQLIATASIKSDMESTRPMDRLLCGDVGFGKTEVALRSAFKAVMSGKQVAVLVPTTLLCEQHFRTFRDRFTEYPVSIEMLSRFRKPAERTRILAQLASGKIDVVIGTHSLLSENIIYKDMGLLIIDEEHRFGVAHKEALKRLRATVDILSMSATPIPRTLYMALVGARDLSVLETPPKNRLPIETTVIPYNATTIAKAIQLELDRNGQVFYLHNRVRSIKTVAEKLQKLAPKARIAFAHGQMPAEDLETIMTQFVAGEYDVLVATTIIESGIDIPRCNTLIVEKADHFGLAQLYQLRGRVGRFDRQAYAYLMLSAEEATGDSYKRLSTLRQHNQLGAGLRIAMKDLELRGAGNLLGAEQSGHIATIGFDLYCELLKVSVARLKGEKRTLRPRAQIRLDFAPLGENSLANPDFAIIPAYIPETYMPELRQRMGAYRELALIDTPQALEAFKEDLEDRYGPLAVSVKVLIEITKIRLTCEDRSFTMLETQQDKIRCQDPQGYIKIGPHFPRLTQKDPWLKLAEIHRFLKQYPPTLSC